jgi:transcriptional regulator with XRE-family HTH domain
MNHKRTEKQFLRKLGYRIRRAREKKGWSQEDLAFECGLHRTYIGSVERGERNIAAINLRKIAAALGVPINIQKNSATFSRTRL